jgi:hypothetical protein
MSSSSRTTTTRVRKSPAGKNWTDLRFGKPIGEPSERQCRAFPQTIASGLPWVLVAVDHPFWTRLIGSSGIRHVIAETGTRFSGLPVPGTVVATLGRPLVLFTTVRLIPVTIRRTTQTRIDSRIEAINVVAVARTIQATPTIRAACPLTTRVTTTTDNRVHGRPAQAGIRNGDHDREDRDSPKQTRKRRCSLQHFSLLIIHKINVPGKTLPKPNLRFRSEASARRAPGMPTRPVSIQLVAYDGNDDAVSHHGRVSLGRLSSSVTQA